MSTEYSNRAIQAVLNGEIGFCKFLSANDTGKTGGHQAGIYIPKSSVKYFIIQFIQRFFYNLKGMGKILISNLI